MSGACTNNQATGEKKQQRALLYVYIVLSLLRIISGCLRFKKTVACLNHTSNFTLRMNKDGFESLILFPNIYIFCWNLLQGLYCHALLHRMFFCFHFCKACDAIWCDVRMIALIFYQECVSMCVYVINWCVVGRSFTMTSLCCGCLCKIYCIFAKRIKTTDHCI